MLLIITLLTICSSFAISNGLENINNYPKGQFGPPVPLKTSIPIESRIIGGQAASITDFPYVASLQHEWEPYQYDTIHYCTAAIISRDWLITTGSCARTIELENVTVRVGSDYFHEGGSVYGIDTHIVHPQFDTLDMDYDVAAIKLNGSLTFSNTVQAIRFTGPDRNVLEDTIFTMTGWGVTDFMGPIDTRLQTVDIPTITTELCKTVWADRITDRMFCAYRENVGMCIGNTGAPTVVDGTVIGIASWTYACATWGWPSVYTDLSSVSEWITQVTGVSSASAISPSCGGSIISVIIFLFVK